MLYTALLFSFSVPSNGERVYPRQDGKLEALICKEGRFNSKQDDCICTQVKNVGKVTAYYQKYMDKDVKVDDIPQPEFDFNFNLCKANQVCNSNEQNVDDMCTLCGPSSKVNVWSGINLSSDECKCRSETHLGKSKMCKAGETCDVDSSRPFCKKRECRHCELNKECCSRYSECSWSSSWGECQPKKKNFFKKITTHSLKQLDLAVI